MESLFIVLPAYNEEKNIEGVVRQWYPLLEGKAEDSKLVIADSGSTDGTHDILLNLQSIYPKLEILSNTEKLHGPKLIALYDYAICADADYIFHTDSDGQTNPDEFGLFWQLRNDYDAVFGCRVNRGDGRVRAFVEKIVCLLLRFYFSVDLPDANAPFRLMNAQILKKYLYRMDKDYNLPNIMITTYFAYYHERITFEPISFKNRQGGKNSINIWKIISIGWNALWDFRKFKKNM